MKVYGEVGRRRLQHVYEAAYVQALKKDLSVRREMSPDKVHGSQVNNMNRRQAKEGDKRWAKGQNSALTGTVNKEGCSGRG